MCELRAGGFDVPGRQCMDGWVAVKDRRAAAWRRRAVSGRLFLARGTRDLARGHETSLEDALSGVFFSLVNFRRFVLGGLFSIVSVNYDGRLGVCGTRSRGFYWFFAAKREVGASTNEVPKKTILGGTKIKPGTRTTN